MGFRKTKIYTHHFTYSVVSRSPFTVRQKLQSGFFASLRHVLLIVSNICFSAGWLVVRSASLSFSVVSRASYLVGLALIYPFSLLFKATQGTTLFLDREIARTEESITQKLRQLRSPQFAYALAVFLFLSIGTIGVFHGANLYASGLELKGKVLGQATKALDSLQKGKDFLGEQKSPLAQKQFEQALSNFEGSRQDIDQAGITLKALLSLVPAKRDADKLVEAGIMLSKSAIEFTAVYDAAQHLKVTANGLEAAEGSALILQSIDEHLHAGIKLLEQGQNNLASVDAGSLPADNQAQFLDARDKLSAALTTLTALEDIARLATALLIGKKDVLLVFQNSNELRSTGGFIGTLGEMRLVDGRIDKLHISSVYDWDGQLHEKIIPPYPLLAINERWFLRDSNWFVDFKQSSEVISSFYEKTTGYTPDMVIALTPHVVVDLLKITGPITLDKYQVTLDADNFVEATQLETSIEYDKIENKPKQMLADFMPVLLGRLTTVPKERVIDIFQGLLQNLDGKNIQFYARDTVLQSQFEEFNWAGRIRETDRDYLTISRSNLNGSKTDLFIKDSISVDSTIQDDGSVVNTLRLTRSNQLPDITTATNISFIRVLVPEGSTLISNKGFSYISLESKQKGEGKVDSRVAVWERHSVKDLATGTIMGAEGGKTFFGNWLELKGGETKTVELSYKLPFKVKSTDHYSILFQKQAGLQGVLVDYTLHFSGRSVAWNNFNPEKLETGLLKHTLTLNKDYFLGLVLQE